MLFETEEKFVTEMKIRELATKKLDQKIILDVLSKNLIQTHKMFQNPYLLQASMGKTFG